jgi:signal transduction histidine kinase
MAAAAALGVAGFLTALALTDVGRSFPAGQRVHVAIQTCGAIVLGVAALLVWKRFHTDARAYAASAVPSPQRLGDVVLAPAVGFLALTTLLFSAIPAIVAETPGAFAIWGQTVGQIVGIGAGAVAAWIPTRYVVRRRVTAYETAGLIGAGILLVAAAALAASQLLDTPSYRPSTLQASWLPAEISLFVLIALAFVGFARRAERERDLLMRGFAVAAPLGAGAVIAYGIGPALGAGWVAAEDLFLLAAYGAIFVGAWSESAAYWERFIELASAEERRRLARDLHDGIAQDLLYIGVQARALVERHPNTESLRGLLYASERALEESRGAIGNLTYPPGEPITRVLESCVRDVARRTGAAATVQVDGEIEPAGGVREAVLRIAREATSNAARHGRASHVLVTLAAGDPLRLTISDDGVGFDAEAALRDGRGFGLEGMQERARTVGGTLSIWSGPSEGTRVTATLPCDRAPLSVGT